MIRLSKHAEIEGSNPFFPILLILPGLPVLGLLELSNPLAILPETKYVITSHIRGSGVTKEEKENYRQVPEVIKVMGFINCKTNCVQP